MVNGMKYPTRSPITPMEGVLSLRYQTIPLGVEQSPSQLQRETDISLMAGLRMLT